MFYNRALEATLRAISDTFPVLILTGPRQVGKTTLLRSMAEPGRKYVALDNPTDRALAKSDPELFLQRFSPPVIIDEVQYAPELFDYIKIHADTHKNCGDYWLTGSQTFQGGSAGADRPPRHSETAGAVCYVRADIQRFFPPAL